MTVLEAPAGANIEVRERRENYAKFVIEPLERGFGITLGNALRRVLLSSIPGAAVTYVKIDGVLHEFSTIPGVVEDTVDLLLNLKGLTLELNTEDTKVISLSTTGSQTANPDDALSEAAQILTEELRLFIGFSTEEKPVATAPASEWDVPVETLNLSVRSFNCLKRAGISKVSELLDMTEDEIIKIRNFGKKSLDEIKQVLEERGLSLRQP